MTGTAIQTRIIALMRWLGLPLALFVLAALAYGLWPSQPMLAEGGLDAAAVAAAVAELDGKPEANAGLVPRAETAPKAEVGPTDASPVAEIGPKDDVAPIANAEAEAEAEAEFETDADAIGSPNKPILFPRDHGAHPAARMELWELTALLRDADGEPIAVRLSLARLGLRSEHRQQLQPRTSALAADAVFAGELVVMMDQSEKPVGMLRAQRLSRAALGLAGAGTDETGVERVWIEQWALSTEDEGTLVLRAEADGVELELGLSPMKSPVVLDQQALAGAGAGASAQPETASMRFYSQSRLAASGRLWVGGAELRLNGLGWLDHGWGALSETLVGGRGQLIANRFQLQLDDGSELACLHLRRRAGGGTPLPNCLLIGVDGEQRLLQRRELRLTPIEDGWQRQGRVEYPLRWRLLIPARELALTIEPLFDGWGADADTVAVKVSGWRGSDAISGHGRMDLNGYAEDLPFGT